MKPSKVFEIGVLSLLGLVGLFCAVITFMDVFMNKQIIVEDGTFLEFFISVIGICVLAVLTIILVFAIVEGFKRILNKADEEWEDSQINNKS